MILVSKLSRGRTLARSGRRSHRFAPGADAGTSARCLSSAAARRGRRFIRLEDWSERNETGPGPRYPGPVSGFLSVVGQYASVAALDVNRNGVVDADPGKRCRSAGTSAGITYTDELRIRLRRKQV